MNFVDGKTFSSFEVCLVAQNIYALEQSLQLLALHIECKYLRKPNRVQATLSSSLPREIFIHCVKIPISQSAVCAF